MSAVLESTRPAGQTKTFGKSTREVPHHTQKAKKYYPAEDEVQAKKVGFITIWRKLGESDSLGVHLLELKATLESAIANVPRYSRRKDD